MNSTDSFSYDFYKNSTFLIFAQFWWDIQTFFDIT